MRCGVIWLFLLLPAGGLNADDGSAVVDYARDIRPLLSRHCYICHGPDDAAREADLRLDRHFEATTLLPSGRRAIVPFHPEQSELIRRVTATDEHRMPPMSQQPLRSEQVLLLSRWIEQGAKWSEHWAFQALRRPNLPHVKHPIWPRNPIDTFILEALERTSAGGSQCLPPEADPTTLLRRVTFDLTGLPPTPEEVDAFLADTSPAAYERVVERLLASPRYGERMATVWLDAARYADTNGYQEDNGRTMWAWRDWVIGALNRNLPFDQFTIEQLAGDLLPQATFEQRLATGLQRNHGLNFEGGSIAEESRWNYVCDRVNTTGTIWLGLTLGCARCHDHKYDPLSQREYYSLAAFFNSVPEEGSAGTKGNAAPLLKLRDEQQALRLARIEARWTDIQQQLTALESGHDAQREQWKRELLAGRQDLPLPPSDVAVYCALDSNPQDEIWDAANLDSPAVIQGAARWTEGRAGDAFLFDGQTRVDLGERGAFERHQPFSLGAWIRPADRAFAPILGKIYYEGYDVCWYDGRLQADIVNRWDNSAISVQTKRQYELDQWHHVLVTYDGSSRAAGVRIYVNGQPAELEITQDCLSGSIRSSSTLHIGARSANTPETFVGAIDDVRLYSRQLTGFEVLLLAQDGSLAAAIRSGQVTAEQHKTLDEYYLKHINPNYSQLLIDRRAAELERTEILEQWPTTMVMEDMAEPRVTHVLQRGMYNQPGETVLPDTPAVLPAFGSDQPHNRLGLARWLVRADHPLTARVAVNRYWEMFFGRGLVATPDDFGVQGARPSHPELLDWLATEFVQSGWDVKHIHRLLVTSATYRQSSQASGEVITEEGNSATFVPQRRLRLSAEMIRDAALAAGGVLSYRMGGPGVMPYQPADLWGELSFRSNLTAQEYRQSSGEDLYRRSLYTYWKRTCPPPAMQIFDAGERQECQIRRTSTNTPLQALVLMNDVTFIEAARCLATRSLERYGNQPDACVRFGFRSVLSREPTVEERELLTDLWRDCELQFQKTPEQARQLLNVGEMKLPAESGDQVALAAATIVMHAIMVLDEAITRN